MTHLEHGELFGEDVDGGGGLLEAGVEQVQLLLRLRIHLVVVAVVGQLVDLPPKLLQVGLLMVPQPCVYTLHIHNYL